MFLGFGAASGPARGTPRAAPPSEAPASAFARSAVPRSSESCPTCCSTVIAFPPPARSTRRVGTAFRRPSGTTRSSDFCRAIVLCSCVLGATACAEPGRSPWVRPMIFVTTSSPVQPRRVRISGFAAGSRLTRRGCLTALRLRSIQPRTYDFHQTSPRGLLGVMSPSEGPGAPGQRPCLFGVGFPPSGPGFGLSPPHHWSCQAHTARSLARRGG